MHSSIGCPRDRTLAAHPSTAVQLGARRARLPGDPDPGQSCQPREDDDEPDPPQPWHSRRRARRGVDGAGRPCSRARRQRGRDRGTRAGRRALRGRWLARAVGGAGERGRADQRLPRRRDLARIGPSLRRDAGGGAQGRDALRPARGVPAPGDGDLRRAERARRRHHRCSGVRAVGRPGRRRRRWNRHAPPAADRRRRIRRP